MAGLILLSAMAGVSAILGIAAAVWGVDTREGFADPNRTHLGLR